MHIVKLTSMLAILVASSACATSKPALEGQLNSEFGAFAKHNIAAHAMPATAAQKANTYNPANPARAALARKNYEENTIDKPKNVDSRESNSSQTRE